MNECSGLCRLPEDDTIFLPEKVSLRRLSSAPVLLHWGSWFLAHHSVFGVPTSDVGAGLYLWSRSLYYDIHDPTNAE